MDRINGTVIFFSDAVTYGALSHRADFKFTRQLFKTKLNIE
jgi:hypothetical protein